MKTFSELFQGRTDCFGIYRVFEVRKDGKQKGKGTTYPNSKYPDRVLEAADWEKHLAGKQMLGIVPVLPDSTCSWFAIDIDDYSISHKAIVVEIEKSELPLVLCRSKSGGAHLYCFVDGFIPAKLAMALGKKWAEILGHPHAEIFPKQETPSVGNWIICPYYGGKKAIDFGIGIEGEQLNLDEFVQWANAKTITPKEAPVYLEHKAVEPGDMSDDEIKLQTPPCIVSMMDDGLPEGGRNNSISHVAVYYQKLDEGLETDMWKDNLLDFNKAHCSPPMTYSEVAQIIRNNSPVGKYQYLCKMNPMERLCQKVECLKRRFGVGEDKSYYGDMEIVTMIKIDSKPPVWIPRINGADVEMDTETLLSPRKFRMAIADVLNILVPQMSQNKHDDVIGPIMKNALTIEAIDELTTSGKVMNSFTEWTKNMVTKSRGMADLEKGLPYYDSEADTIYFRGADFIKEYKRVHKDNATDRGIWSAMRNNDFSRKQIKMGTKPEWVWFFPLAGDDKWFEIELGERF